MVYVGYCYDFHTIGSVYWIITGLESNSKWTCRTCTTLQVFQVALEHRYQGSGSGTPRFWFSQPLNFIYFLRLEKRKKVVLWRFIWMILFRWCQRRTCYSLTTSAYRATSFCLWEVSAPSVGLEGWKTIASKNRGSDFQLRKTMELQCFGSVGHMSR